MQVLQLMDASVSIDNRGARVIAHPGPAHVMAGEDASAVVRQSPCPAGTHARQAFFHSLEEKGCESFIVVPLPVGDPDPGQGHRALLDKAWIEVEFVTLPRKGF